MVNVAVGGVGGGSFKSRFCPGSPAQLPRGYGDAAIHVRNSAGETRRGQVSPPAQGTGPEPERRTTNRMLILTAEEHPLATWVSRHRRFLLERRRWEDLSVAIKTHLLSSILNVYTYIYKYEEDECGFSETSRALEIHTPNPHTAVLRKRVENRRDDEIGWRDPKPIVDGEFCASCAGGNAQKTLALRNVLSRFSSFLGNNRGLHFRGNPFVTVSWGGNYVPTGLWLST